MVVVQGTREVVLKYYEPIFLMMYTFMCYAYTFDVTEIAEDSLNRVVV